jgi:transcriptional regulator with XRE-family HTH domain
MNAIAQSLYIARLQKGLSQKELSRRTGIPQPNISQIEKGRDLKVSTLCQLALALEVPVEDLLRGAAPLSLDKRKFFRRDHIERTVTCIAQEEQVLREFRPTVRLLESVIGQRKGYISKKDLHLSWATLKRTFSREEINAILSRIGKARKRLG